MESGSDALGIGVILVAVFAALVFFGIWLWSLIHCIRNKYLNDTNRVLGIVLIALLGILGSLVYLFLPREAEAQR